MMPITLYLRSVGPGCEVQHIALVAGRTLFSEYFRSSTVSLCGRGFGRSAQYSRKRFRAVVVCDACHAALTSRSSLPIGEAGQTQDPDPGLMVRERSGTPPVEVG